MTGTGTGRSIVAMTATTTTGSTAATAPDAGITTTGTVSGATTTAMTGAAIATTTAATTGCLAITTRFGGSAIQGSVSASRWGRSFPATATDSYIPALARTR